MQPASLLSASPPQSMMRRSLILAAAFLAAPTVWAEGEDAAEEDAGYVSSTVRAAAARLACSVFFSSPTARPDASPDYSLLA